MSTNDTAVRQHRIDTIAATAKKAAVALSPYYSVFRVSAKGDYCNLYFGKNAKLAAEHYLNECQQPFAVGVEMRVDGVRVEI